jgi:hypothetical protein
MAKVLDTEDTTELQHEITTLLKHYEKTLKQYRSGEVGKDEFALIAKKVRIKLNKIRKQFQILDSLILEKICRLNDFSYYDAEYSSVYIAGVQEYDTRKEVVVRDIKFNLIRECAEKALSSKDPEVWDRVRYYKLMQKYNKSLG